MTDLQRLRKVLNWLIYNEYAQNDTDIAAKLGYVKSSFSQIVNGKKPISEKFVNKLCSADKKINKVWLLTGKGEILKNDIDANSQEIIAALKEEIKILKVRLEEKDITIDRLIKSGR